MSDLPRIPIDSSIWRTLPPLTKVALVQSVWEGAGSARGIAAALGPGISRNAVIGVYERNKGLAATHPLGPTAKSLAARKYTKKAPAVKPPKKNKSEPYKLPAVPREIPQTPTFRNVTLVALARNECKWPSGDPKEPGFGFCGNATDGGPYCEYHATVAYHSPKDRK